MTLTFQLCKLTVNTHSYRASGTYLRLRIETQLGYKMVKWLKSIEFVSDYKKIGMGYGGHREDHMFYGRGAGI
jgi:methionine sulfoxide reductase catalytic subunit